MPNRLFSVGLLVFWAVAALALFFRDILPDLVIGPPPDLRSLSRANADPEPTHWTIQVDDERSPGNYRPVGQLETSATTSKRDHWFQLTSVATIDSGAWSGLVPAAEGEKIQIRSVFDIDPLGNLYRFRTEVKVLGHDQESLSLEGRLKNNAIAVTARSPLQIPLLNWSREFPYQARGMVQNNLGPLDQMPGLKVGQRWESQVISPLTNQVQTVRVEVAGRHVLDWDNGPVNTFEVVTRLDSGGPRVSFKTWVRPDGLVLRQEVPLPIVKLYLERLPDRLVPKPVKVPRP